MKRIKILGSGCRNCKTTMARVEKVVRELGIEAETVKIEDIAAIMSYGVMSTPAVVVDGKLVHAGGVPDEEDIKKWLE